MKVMLAIPKGIVNTISIDGTLLLLESVKKETGGFFEVKTGCLGSRKPLKLGRHTIDVDVHLEAVTQIDLIIVPALLRDCSTVVAQNKDLIEWVRYIHLEQGSQVASLCTGAYILAESGLLDGKEASSHWNEIHHLRQQYPKIDWRPEKIITDQSGVYTSGGAFSSFNLILYLIEKFVGAATAHHLSKVFEISYPLESQTPFMIFNNQKNHGDPAVVRIQSFMEAHLDEPVNIDQLAAQVNMSRRNFIRRFKAATQTTPGRYFQQLRMEKAKRLLETTDKTVGEVMGEVAYNDLHTFRTAFKKHAGYLPSSYKKQFGRG